MKFTKLVLIPLLAVPIMSTTATANVDINANVSANNNYVWRGMTQTNNQSSVQGGIDLSMDAFYVGAWSSNVLNDTEVDGYIGLKGSIADNLEYDVGFIRYGYMDTPSNNFNEVYLALTEKLSYGNFSIKYSKGLDDAPDDIAMDVSVLLTQEYSLDLGWGDYKDVAKRYSVGVSKSFDKVDFSIAYHNAKVDDATKEDEKNIVVSVGTSF